MNLLWKITQFLRNENDIINNHNLKLYKTSQTFPLSSKLMNASAIAIIIPDERPMIPPNHIIIFNFQLAALMTL